MYKRHYLYQYLLLIVLWGYSLIASAHPHSYIDLNARLLVKQNTLTGIEFSWQMDEITSLSLTYDIFQRMPYPQALDFIAKEMTNNVRAEQFFTHISQNNQPIKWHLQKGSPQAQQQKLNTIFSFILDFDQPLELSQLSLILMTYEPSYYVSMSYVADTDLDGTALPSQCHIELVNPNYDAYWLDYAQSLDQDDAPSEESNLGEQFAQKVILTCQ